MPMRWIRREWKAFKCLFIRFRNSTERSAFWVLFFMALLAPLEYMAIISIPDSTDYFLQEVDSATKLDDGRNAIYVGDNLHVVAYNWRHKLNGTCTIRVNRVRENVGGKYDKKRTAFQTLDQQFVGDGIIRRTSWPLAPATIPITEAWFDDPSATEQEMDIFTTGWYKCNWLDVLRVWAGVPRLHHNANGDPERERTRVVLRRK